MMACRWTYRNRAVAGSLRRLIRPADSPRLSPIRSLAYFRPVIEELRAHPAPESYLDYLRLNSAKPQRPSAGECPENYVF